MAFGNISLDDECRFAFQENMEMRETDVGLLVAEITTLPILTSLNALSDL